MIRLELTRRHFLALAYTSFGLPEMARAETYNTYLYEAIGSVGETAITLPLTLQEKIDRAANTYHITIKGGIRFLASVNVDSKGIIANGHFRPTESAIEMSGILPTILLHRDTEISYHWDAEQPYATFKRGWTATQVPIRKDAPLDDIGSAYLNYRYHGSQPGKKTFPVWLLSNRTGAPNYTALSITELLYPNSRVLLTKDFNKLLKGVDRGSVTRARFSLEQKVVEEVHVRVRGRDITVRRVA
ncbi:hypothetical protein HYV81_01560 [Candidatus Woesearchaeota archaeon]|nr:hypothetical protein [Candidatus Woesearchaeota archaeon]